MDDKERKFYRDADVPVHDCIIKKGKIKKHEKIIKTAKWVIATLLTAGTVIVGILQLLKN